MRLNSEKNPVRWSDRTLSVLRASRLEACEKELAGLGGCALFDDGATDLDAERLFEESYLAGEEKDRRLHTIDELKTRVQNQFLPEMTLLSQEEFGLVMKLALFSGELPLFDGNDLIPARSLIRRMWCRMRPERGHWLYMPRPLCFGALLVMSVEEVKKVRALTDEIIDTVDNTLYLAGMMPAEIVISDIAQKMKGTHAENRTDLYIRLLKASFETTTAPDGRLMLVHSGLADPHSMAQKVKQASGLGMDQNALTDLYGTLMDVEDPLYDRMMNLISEVSRPETDAEDAVEDLILLAKQGAPLSEMREVLSGKIICLPTEDMLEGLKALHDRIPKWFTLNMERVQ